MLITMLLSLITVSPALALILLISGLVAIPAMLYAIYYFYRQRLTATSRGQKQLNSLLLASLLLGFPFAVLGLIASYIVAFA
jgi:hypothetical protein